MKILYIGRSAPISAVRQRTDALVRIGHGVSMFDPCADLRLVPGNGIAHSLHRRSGSALLQGRVDAWIRGGAAKVGLADVAWVDNGELFGSDPVKLLRSVCAHAALYSDDDAARGRDGPCFQTLRHAVGHYDMCVVQRVVNVSEHHALGARDVMRVMASNDEVAHRPLAFLTEIPQRLRSGVTSVGPWRRSERRDGLLAELAARKISIAIWGARWQESRHWKRLAPYWRGGSVFGNEYVSAIAGAKVCLALLSDRACDGHTKQTFEIPCARGVLCAERSSEHEQLFEDGMEAVLWSSVTECAQLCRALLEEDAWRERLREAGHRKVLALSRGHEDVCRAIIPRLVEDTARVQTDYRASFTQ